MPENAINWRGRTGRACCSQKVASPRSALAISALNGSYTHTHTHMHARAHTCMRAHHVYVHVRLRSLRLSISRLRALSALIYVSFLRTPAA
jgi:hypothetical protein